MSVSSLHVAGEDPLEEYAPFIPWEQFINQFVWNQGEHVALIGHTGSGKTTLLLSILGLRTFATLFATKPKDDTLDHFVESKGYKALTTWDHRMSAEKYPRRILWPESRGLYSGKQHRYVFADALASIYEQGSWCVAMDEVWIMSQSYKLDFEIRTYLQQGRSIGLSFVGATQRPAWVPLELYSESTHLFLWASNDRANIQRLSDINSRNTEVLRQIIPNLRKHECLYVNTRDQQICRTMSPAYLA